MLKLLKGEWGRGEEGKQYQPGLEKFESSLSLTVIDGAGPPSD